MNLSIHRASKINVFRSHEARWESFKDRVLPSVLTSSSDESRIVSSEIKRKTSYKRKSKWLNTLKWKTKEFNSEEKIKRGVEEIKAKRNIVNRSQIKKLKSWIEAFIKKAGEILNSIKPMQHDLAYVKQHKH